MSNRIIWSFGGILIGTNSTSYVNFPYAQTKIRFAPEYNQFQTIGRQDRYVFKGWRVYVSTTLHNIMTGDPDLWVSLIGYLNSGMAAGNSFWICPRYDSDVEVADRPAYTMALQTDIDPQDIGQGAAQSIELSWKATDLITQLPSYASDSTSDNWADEDDDLYVDESGNQYQLQS